MNYILEYPKSAILYTIVCIITLILARLAVRQKKQEFGVFFVFLIIMIYSLVAGLRGHLVGNDTANYVTHIYYWQTLESYVRYPTEPGLKVISLLLSMFIKSPVFVLFFVSLITNGLIISRLWSYREKINFELALLIYSLYYYAMTLSGMRQWIAVAIVFWSSKYILENKYIKYTLMLLVATLFHNTAIISLGVILLHLINKGKYNKNKLLISLLIFPPLFIVILLFFEFQFSLFSQYSSYLNELQFQSGSGFTLWIRVIFAITIFFLIDKQKFKDFEEYNFFKFNYIIYIFGLLLIIPGYYIENLNRLAFYYSINELVVFGVLGKYYKDTIIKIFLSGFILFLMLLYVLELANSGLGHMPYIPFWEDSLMQFNR